jgi:hypothetical protein
MQYSDAIRNARLASDETVVGTAPLLRTYGAAAMPANCNTAAAGTMLTECTLPADWQTTPSGGAAAKSGTWQDPSANATGYARYFRMYDSTGTTCHMQGLVSMPWSATTTVAAGYHMHNGGNVYLCTTGGTTAGSGGPTGTGTGIADGSAVWSYVGPVEMTVDNVSTAAGQPFVVNTFTRTAAGG